MRGDPARISPVDAADHMLIAGSGDLDTAYTLYGDAAASGSALAAHRLAVLHALGVGRPASWSQALDFLDRTAQLGHPTAARQRALIDGWDLRPPVDMTAANHDPAIIALSGLVPPAVCRWIIDLGRGRLMPGQVNHISTGAPKADPMRTAEAAHFQLFDIDLVLALVLERISRVTGLPVHHFEPANLLHYDVGQEYRPHFDFMDPAVPGFQQQLAIFGQRIATVLVYLNADYEGGETSFPALDLKFRGMQGDALVFFNVGKDGQPHRRSLHAGLPPTRGRKWVLSIWVRDRVQPIL